MTQIEEIRDLVRARIESLESEYGPNKAFDIAVHLMAAYEFLEKAAVIESSTPI